MTKPLAARAEESESANHSREWNCQSFFRGWWTWDDVRNVIKPCHAMIDSSVHVKNGVCESSVVGEWHDYATPLTLFIGSILVATVFGGIHCIGWSFDFPSYTEQLLWRISSV
jgi:hypothetical protein